jgi:PhnB protein
MQITPYLNFDGHCAEAFAFYARLLGGRIVQQRTFDEMPRLEGMPPLPTSARQRILHAHLQVEGQSLLGSDTLPGADAGCGGFQAAQGMWVSIQADDIAEGQRLFDALAEGGQTVMPFAATFWSPGFGMVRDRFGTPWMIGTAASA